MVCSIGIPYPNFASYAEDNSLSENQTVENSRWCGRGAESLELKGKVTPTSYKNAYQGVDDHGSSLRRKLKGKNSIAGRDLTFSAPKSVSVLALVKEDKQILNAHNRAINSTLLYIEQNCIYTRTGKGGSNKEQTQNMVAAIFQHSDSRNFDPNLHSHCVIFNQTQARDGKWRAMDNRELYQQKMTLGSVYRHELASQLIELGHELNWSRNGTFELADFKPEQLQQFSSRRAEIINLAGEDSNSKEKARACISTRNQKRYLNADERKIVRSSWVKTYVDWELSFAQNKSISTPDPGKINQNFSQLLSPEELIEKTIQSLADKGSKTRFFKHELLKEVLIQAQGQYKLESLQRGLDKHSSLIEIEDKKFTTIKLYQKEKVQKQRIEHSSLTAQQEKKEISVLELATEMLDNESHQQFADSAFKNEKFNLIEADIGDDKMSQVVENYLQQVDISPNSIVVIADTKAEENKLTLGVRERLIQSQKLGDIPIRSVCLQRKELKKQDLSKSENYQVGNMIKFKRQSKNLSNQHLYKVLSIDEDKKVLGLGDRFGNKVDLPMTRYLDREVYEVKRRELRLNEKLRFTRNQYIKDKQVSIGQPFTVTKIENKQRITININGKRSIVNSSELLYADYNYSDTLVKCQYKKIDRCIYSPSAARSEQLLKQDIYDIATFTKDRLTVYAPRNFIEQYSLTKTQNIRSVMDTQEAKDSQVIDTQKPISDTLHELASSSKYIAIHEGTKIENTENRDIYHSPDGVTIERDPQNLSIYYNGKSVEFDRDFNVISNEFSTAETQQLNQKTQEIKQEIKQKNLEQSRHKQIQRNI
ncbi:MAG: MobF family relaxase, partial [Cyanobacteria bacterium J06600_6]